MTADVSRAEYYRGCELLGLEPLVDPLPARRNAHLPTWYSTAMVSTKAAREKLRAWASSTPRDEWERPIDAAAVVVALHMYGDELLTHVLGRTLALLPPPLRGYAIAACTFVGIGRALHGWCGPRIDYGSRPWFIPICATDVDGVDRTPDVAVHEVCHAWLLHEPAPHATCRTALWHQITHDAPFGPIDAETAAIVREVRAMAHQAEREVLRLTRALGFADLGSAAGSR